MFIAFESYVVIPVKGRVLYKLFSVVYSVNSLSIRQLPLGPELFVRFRSVLKGVS